MKKLLLTAVAACAVLGASASLSDYSSVWNSTVANSYKAGEAIFNAKVAVDTKGNTLAAGAFTEDLTLGGASLTALGQSAYLAKYDATGAAKWAVAFTGAVSVSDIALDADGNIYVSAAFADEVELGTTAGTAATIEGLKIEGAFTSDLCASFIAKYDADGKLLAHTTFVPEGFANLAETGMYFPTSEDLIFNINHLEAADGKVYASALFSGYTEKDGVKFDASYNDPWFGMFYVHLKGAAVFSLNSDLTGCANVLTCNVGEPLAVEDGQYQANSVTFTAFDGEVFCAFSGNGPLKFTAANNSKTSPAEASQYNYYFTVVNNGTLGTVAQNPAPEAGMQAKYVVSEVNLNAKGGMDVVGYEDFAENAGTDNQVLDQRMFLQQIAPDFKSVSKHVFTTKEGDVNYYGVTGVAVAEDGTYLINALGYYTASNETEGYRKGDFAGKVKSYSYDMAEIKENTLVADAYGVAAAGDYLAFSQIGETGATYSLFGTGAASIGNVAVDGNQPAEYFNLQGIRVENPANGIFIERRGGAAKKVLVK